MLWGAKNTEALSGRLCKIGLTGETVSTWLNQAEGSVAKKVVYLPTESMVVIKHGVQKHQLQTLQLAVDSNYLLHNLPL